MKKIAFLISLVMICCLLCACDPAIHTADQSSLSQVVSIELIQYDNTNQKHFASWVPDQFYRLMSFDLDKLTVLEILPAEKNHEFLEMFLKAEILSEYYAYNSPKDVCIRLNYQNGNFLILWADYDRPSYAGYIGEYDSSGNVLSFWGSFCALEDYKYLVNHFFTYQL